MKKVSAGISAFMVSVTFKGCLWFLVITDKKMWLGHLDKKSVKPK